MTTCEICATREAEYEIRKTRPNESDDRLNQAVCRVCLGKFLAEDTASIVKISKPADDAGSST